MHRLSLHLLGLLTPALALFACGETTPEEVQQRTAPIVSRVIAEVQSSWTAARQMGEVKQLLEGVGVMVPGLSSDDVANADLGDEQVAAEINEALAKYVFTEKNVESTSSDSVLFLVRGSVICAGLTEEQCVAPEGGEPSCSTSHEVSPECVDAVDRARVRIMARLVGSDGVDLELSIGGSATVITLRLRHDRVSVELSLAGAAEAARSIAELVGESIELPTTFEGALSATLILGGSGDLTLQSAVTKAVKVEWNKGSYRVAVEARDPVTQLRFRKAVPSIELDVDWGALQVLLPAEELWSQASGALELAVKGLTAHLASNGKGGLSVKDLSLGQGPARLTLGNKTLVQVDLNPATGRQVDLVLTPWQNDLPQCSVSPELNLHLRLALAPLASLMDEAPEPWALDESYQLKLTSGALVGPVRESGGFTGGLKLLAGQLTLQSLVQPASLTVPAGSCLFWSDAQPDGSHPLFGHLVVQACQ